MTLLVIGCTLLRANFDMFERYFKLYRRRSRIYWSSHVYGKTFNDFEAAGPISEAT